MRSPLRRPGSRFSTDRQGEVVKCLQQTSSARAHHGQAITRQHVERLDDRAIMPLACLAVGRGITHTARRHNCDRQDVIYLIEWTRELFGVSVSQLRTFCNQVTMVDAVPEVLKTYLEGREGRKMKGAEEPAA